MIFTKGKLVWITLLIISAAIIRAGYTSLPPSKLSNADAEGNKLLQRGAFNRAMVTFAHAAHRNPRDTSAFVGLAAVAMRTGRYQIALANLHQAEVDDPRDADIWHVIGDVEARLRRSVSAIAAYRRAVRLNAKDEVAWRQMGILLTRALDYPMGMSALREAVRLAPWDSKANDALAANALAQGQLTIAQSAYRQTLRCSAQDAQALAGLADVEMQMDPSATGLASAELMARRSLNLQPNAYTHLLLGHIYLVDHKFSLAIKELNIAKKGQSTNQSLWLWLAQAYDGLGRTSLAAKAIAQSQECAAGSGSKKAILRSGGIR